MENTYRPRPSFGKILKRIILITLAALIVIFVALFFLVRYKAEGNTYYNKYDDAYWNKEVLDGFSYYPELISGTSVYNMLSEDYKYPWTAAGKSSTSLTDMEKIDMARYKEELAKIDALFQYSSGLKAAKEELERIQNAKWDSSKDIYEWILEKLEMDRDSYESRIPDIAEATAYEYASNNGYEGTEDEFKQMLKYSLNVMTALDNTSFSGRIYNLCAAIAKDTALYDYLCEFDQDASDAAEAKVTTAQTIVDHLNATSENLPSWNDYYINTLLGFGGLATPYPNSPVLTKTLDNGNKYEFWFHTYYTTFKIVLKDASDNVLQEWYSNPQDEDPVATQTIKNLEKAVLTVSYAVLKGQTGTYSNYEYSVTPYDLNSNEDLTPNFAVNFDVENNRVIVWYQLERRGIDYSYFPKYISAERLREVVARSKERAENHVVVQMGTDKGKEVKDLATQTMSYAELTQSIYKLIPASNTSLNEYGYDYYEYQGTISTMSDITRKKLYLWLYEWCGYTTQDLIEDNEQFGESVDISRPSFKIAIEYMLTDNGLEVTIPGNSLKETAAYPMTYIEVLPYFTATKAGVGGYTIIPDGSGAILEHDNGNTNYGKYSKRVYTTDLTTIPYVNAGSSEDLMFPMYGVVNDDKSAIICYAVRSGAQMLLSADVSGRNNNYNTNFFTVFVRESKKITVGTASYERKSLVKWTNAMATEDIEIRFDTIEEENQSYSGVAAKYREILKKHYGFEDRDTTTSPVLNMDVIGSYSFRDNFIGIPFTNKDSLTTIDQLREMMKAIHKTGVKNINVSYLGWRDSNLTAKTFGNLKVSNLIGSKAKFRALIADNNNNDAVYPYVQFGQFTDFTELFGKNHYVAHAVDGNLAKSRPYDLNSNVFNKTKPWVYALSPRYYLVFATSLGKNIAKLTNSSYLAVNQLGSTLSGDYKKGVETFKVDAVNHQIEAFDALNKEGITNITLYTPYDYAIKYASVIKNVPYQYTAYEILDYSIPFYQLVINGLVDYSGESVNAYSEKGLTEHIMRMIETGSNIDFTFTYESSEKLLQTDYNTYYYTQYTDWLDDVAEIYQTLDDLGIYAMRLTSHERVDNNVFKVVYSDGTNTKTIYLNYTRNPYHATDGTVVEAKSFAVGL